MMFVRLCHTRYCGWSAYLRVFQLYARYARGRITRGRRFVDDYRRAASEGIL